MLTDNSTLCKNCDELLTGKYCSGCGQSADTERISSHSILHEIEHGIIHIDKGIFYTIKELLLRPGKTIKGYLAGKRVDHFKPFAFLFITATIYAVLAKFTPKGTLFNEIVIKDDSGEQIIFQALEWAKNHYAYATIILLPLSSLSTLIVFRKNAYNYFEHLVINAYTTGFKTFLHLTLLPFYFILTSEAAISRFESIKYFLGLSILFYFYFQVFDNSSIWKRILKAVFAIILSNFIIIFILFVVILLSTD